MEIKVYNGFDRADTFPLEMNPSFLLSTLSSLDLCRLLFNSDRQITCSYNLYIMPVVNIYSILFIMEHPEPSPLYLIL